MNKLEAKLMPFKIDGNKSKINPNSLKKAEDLKIKNDFDIEIFIQK